MLRNGPAHRFANCWEHIDDSYQVRNAAGRKAGGKNHQRYLQSRVVNKQSVAHFAVFPKSFSMIGGQDDQGGFVPLMALQELEELCQFLIDVQHFLLIGLHSIHPMFAIRMMRIKKVDPQKERLFSMRSEPRLRRVSNALSV